MAETLALDLDQDSAAALYLVIEIAIDSLHQKKEILEQVKELPKADRPEDLIEDATIEEVLTLNSNLMSKAKEISKEVGQIILELDKPKPLIIPSPKFSARE